MEALLVVSHSDRLTYDMHVVNNFFYIADDHQVTV